MSGQQAVVEMSDGVRATLWRLGSEAEDAMEGLFQKLEENPLLGEYDTAEMVYRASASTVGGEELIVRYLFGPPRGEEDIVRILSFSQVRVPAQLKYGEDGEYDDPPGPVPGPKRVDPRDPRDPRLEEIEVRQVTDAWQRIVTWLTEYAPASAGALRPGASEAELAGLEETLGVGVPAELKALWGLNAGVDNVDGAGFLLRNWALMTPDSVISFYRMQMGIQQRDGNDEFTVWKPSWIPVCSFGAADVAFGLYLDTRGGELWRWSRYGDVRAEPEFRSVTVLLEEMADALEAPSLAGLPEPGLVEGGLSWGPPSDPDRAALWEPLAG
ncbi:SMI1/KNR4 family protein [Streptomyces phaeochromogenes]|uniref:SMI1/KNR4 family protein n=1 Tax=Streptomyces phaeochromogenes TaxID=1923 RepID=UPI00371DFD48